MSLSLPKTTTPTLSGSKLRAMPFRPELGKIVERIFSTWLKIILTWIPPSPQPGCSSDHRHGQYLIRWQLISRVRCWSLVQKVNFYAIDRPSPIERTRPVSSRLAAGAAPRILSSKMEEISLRAACHRNLLHIMEGEMLGLDPHLQSNRCSPLTSAGWRRRWTAWRPRPWWEPGYHRDQFKFNTFLLANMYERAISYG